MSAWVVSRAHIDVLVQALAEGEHVTDVDPDVIGTTLWRENQRSVNYRYGERDRTPQYRYRRPRNKPDLDVLHKAVACYQYQACERPDWPGTLAYRWTTDLREALEAARGTDQMAEGLTGWGLSEPEVHGERGYGSAA